MKKLLVVMMAVVSVLSLGACKGASSNKLVMATNAAFPPYEYVEGKEIVGIDADERFIDSKGKLNLQQCGLMAFAHGEYFALGRKLGDFGFSVRKKKKHRKPPKKS